MNKLQEYLDYNKNKLNSDENARKSPFVQYITENFGVKIPEIKKQELPQIEIGKLLNIESPIVKQPIKARYQSIIKEEVPPVKVKASATQQQKEFMEKYYPIAVKIGKEYNIDPNVMISQAAFESGYGTNTLAKEGNAFFSIINTNKNRSSKVQAYDKNAKGNVYSQSFRGYDTPEEAFRDWAELISKDNRYRQVYLSKNPEEFLNQLALSPYASGIGDTLEIRQAKKKKAYSETYQSIKNIIE